MCVCMYVFVCDVFVEPKLCRIYSFGEYFPLNRPIYVCMYVCIHVCKVSYVFMYEYMHGFRIFTSQPQSMSVCFYAEVCTYICMHACMYVCVCPSDTHLLDCMHACMYICTSSDSHLLAADTICVCVCMHVCMYVCIRVSFKHTSAGKCMIHTHT